MCVTSGSRYTYDYVTAVTYEIICIGSNIMIALMSPDTVDNQKN